MPTRKTFTRPRPVEVFWADAATCNRWGTIEEHQEHTPAAVRSVGYLSLKTPKVIQILQSIGQDSTAADSLTIPRQWVKKVRRLR